MDDVASVSSLREALENIVGEYEPVEIIYDVERVEYVVVADELGFESVVSQPYTETVVEYMPDWSWFASVFVLCMCLYCFFRCVGGLLKWKI